MLPILAEMKIIFATLCNVFCGLSVEGQEKMLIMGEESTESYPNGVKY